MSSVRHHPVPRPVPRLRIALVGMILAVVSLAPASASASVSKLPKGFLWGVATSAFQVEGHTNNSNWAYYARRDSGPSPVGSPKAPYRNSADFYDHFRKDIKRAADLGINTFRMSINWARIEPARGKFSEAGLRFYDRVIARLEHFGIKPLITLNHWDYPMWAYRAGGWTNPRMVADFLAMAKKVVTRYRHQVRYWITFNEEFFYEFMEKGNFPLTDKGVGEMRANLIKAHRRAYDLIHRIEPNAMVSTNYAWAGNGPFTSLATDPFQKAIADKLDYVAVDYYYPVYDQLSVVGSLVAGRSWDVPVDAFGMYTALRQMHRAFPRLPIIIAENGTVTEGGMPRADGVKSEKILGDTLYWVQRARQDGVPVIGYFYWSLIDNYEWGSFRPRYGLYSINPTDHKLTRRPTATVKAYHHWIASHGVPANYKLVYPSQAANCQSPSVAEADRATCLKEANGS